MEAGVVELQHRQPRQLADFWRQATSERVQVIAEAQASQAAQLSQEGRHREGGAEPPRREGRSAEEARLDPWVCTLRQGSSHAAGGK